MRCIINPICLLPVLVFFLSTKLHAESNLVRDTISPTQHFYTLEGGVFVGGANAYVDVGDANLFSFDKTSLSFGLLLDYNVSANFGLRLNLLHTTLNATDLGSTEFEARGFSFETPLTEASLTAKYTFNDRGRSSGVAVAPYLFAGVGVAITDPNVDFSNAEGNQALMTRVQEDIANVQTNHITVPFGIGLKAGLTEQIQLSVELGLRPAFNDYIDGVSIAANPNKNDWYNMGGIALSYRFGKKKTIKKRLSPEERAEAKLPDSDGDGLADKYDECPDIAGSEDAGGCPDEDLDGVADKDDECLGVPGSKPAKGCPDQDYDGVPDDEDLCPYLPGTVEAKGCRDTDKDGVFDNEDQCPYIKGEASNHGCPVTDKDSDDDGVLDKDDKCPNKPGPYNGCPDSDGDGLADNVDNCPEVAGKRSNRGCPELSQEDKTILESAINNVKFQRGSYTLLSSSSSMLNQVADLMRRYPTYHLSIEGYTDNQGDDNANVRLSENRAKACLDYLHQKGGIAEERMSYKGFGKANPRATNETISGRRQNRRVEFKIIPN